MTLHRKIGGIHWFAIGPYRVSFCKKRSELHTISLRQYHALCAKGKAQPLHTYCNEEHNTFIF